MNTVRLWAEAKHCAHRLAGAVALGLLVASAGHAQTDRIAALEEQRDTLRKQGRYAAALPLAVEIVTLQEQALGPDHLEVARALVVLAQTDEQTGRATEAIPVAQRALAIREKALGPDHPDVAAALMRIGSPYAKRNRNAEAEPLYRRALAIR